MCVCVCVCVCVSVGFCNGAIYVTVPFYVWGDGFTMGPNGPKLSSGPVSLECMTETL